MKPIRAFSISLSIFVLAVLISGIAPLRAQTEMLDSQARIDRAPEGDRIPLKNWLIPFPVAASPEDRAISPMALPSLASHFIAITPCRVVDTRNANGPHGGPILTGGVSRSFNITTGPCAGIPVAAGYSLNLAVTGSAPGSIQFLTAYPAGTMRPLVATMNFDGGETTSNAALVPPDLMGAVEIYASTDTHVIIDINGYFAEGVVTSFNTMKGAVSLVAGADLILLPPVGQSQTILANSTSANIANTLVRRDGVGAFSAGNINAGNINAGNINAGTVALTGNLTLPDSSSTAGALTQLGNRLLHTTNVTSEDLRNVFLGLNAGNFTTVGGIRNTGIGEGALASLGNGTFFAGNDNTAVGSAALVSNTTGDQNIAIGRAALISNTTGGGNIGIGGGSNLTTGSNNIDIGHAGVAAESGAIRIGTSGTHTSAFLQGVAGVTSANGVNVLINSAGQLGTVLSSATVKRDIAGLGEQESALMKLRPVSFLYSKDPEGIRQYGLIAEEVAEVMPELVQYSPEGKPQTVRYHFLAPLLLNEMQKQQQMIEQQRQTIGVLEARVAEITSLEARLTALEKQPRDSEKRVEVE